MIIDVETGPKPLLRNEMKRRRAGLATAQPLAGDRLAEEITGELNDRMAWPDAGALIAGYYPIQSEINPLPLLQVFAERDYPLCLPCLVAAGEGYRMIFREFALGDDLVRGPFDIRQPADEAAIVTPDVVLLPLLAFDRKGHRLGYGGGYYDRALEALRAHKAIRAIGVAFSGQEVAEIPLEAHDQPLDGIFTETGLIGAGPLRT